MAEGSRRFPPPWRADRTPHGYVVRDANGQELAYIYSRENEDEARQAKVLTKDEARRIAINIARLPDLLGNASVASCSLLLLKNGSAPITKARVRSSARVQKTVSKSSSVLACTA